VAVLISLEGGGSWGYWLIVRTKKGEKKRGGRVLMVSKGALIDCVTHLPEEKEKKGGTTARFNRPGGEKSRVFYWGIMSHSGKRKKGGASFQGGRTGYGQSSAQSEGEKRGGAAWAQGKGECTL